MKRADNKSGRIYHNTERISNKKDAHSGERIVTYTSRIRAIGNSRGIILNNKVMEATGLTSDTEIIVHAENGVITITRADTSDVNTDLSTWDKHFKTAIKRGALPENDLFEGMVNDFDKNEW